eukprot:m.422310 g.422310  ORF g.422310 m.422310 type:complete len:516 (+) comp20198_c4_seq18:1066-2613(+)
MDLVTISSCHGIQPTREPAFDGLFVDTAEPTLRPHLFAAKKVFYLSSRVHPGETPASHVFNGFLKFILDPNDPRAAVARSLYVFKLVPMLNPDGCKRGHYRSDSRGANLNRVYDKPDRELHPTIFATKSILLHHYFAGQLKFFVDLHGHAAKRGCFMYGNALQGQEHVDNVLFAKLVAMNSPHFDFGGCNFSEKNMFSKDKQEQSKEGSGRVATYMATGIVHCYTLECNYNTGRRMNQLAVATGEGEHADKPPYAGTPPTYSPDVLEDVGRGVALAALDIVDKNPWSRIPNSEYGSLHALRKWVQSHISNARSKSSSTVTTRAALQAARKRIAQERQQRERQQGQQRREKRSNKSRTVAVGPRRGGQAAAVASKTSPATDARGSRPQRQSAAAGAPGATRLHSRQRLHPSPKTEQRPRQLQGSPAGSPNAAGSLDKRPARSALPMARTVRVRFVCANPTNEKMRRNEMTIRSALNTTQREQSFKRHSSLEWIGTPPHLTAHSHNRHGSFFELPHL